MKGGLWLRLVIAAVLITSALYIYAILPKAILPRPEWAQIESVKYLGRDITADVDAAGVVGLMAQARCRLVLTEDPTANRPLPVFEISGREGQRSFNLLLWEDLGYKIRDAGKPYEVLDARGLIESLEALNQKIGQ